MILLQLFIPMNDSQGKAFPQNIFTEIKELLADKFGGVTSFSQNPAEGLWEEDGAIHKDIIIIYEVMIEEMDKNWWYAYQEKLERRLEQKKILIRWSEVETL